MGTHVSDVETEALRGEVTTLKLTTHRPQGWAWVQGLRVPASPLPASLLCPPRIPRAWPPGGMSDICYVDLNDQQG